MGKKTRPLPKRAAKPAKVAKPPKTDKPEKPEPFGIVGIGASAGGLEALELFLKHVPAESGLAYVVVQHLDPNRKGMMVEILQRSSPIEVVQITDQLKLAPNHVYVIPPNKELTILHGVLHLLPLVNPRGLNLPIDFFFRALADDQQDNAVAVVLSGMGSDGTLGIRAIKEKAGVTYVQALDSAKYDGMPRSAIDAGFADVVAAAEDLPAKILEYRKRIPRSAPGEERHSGELDKVFVLLRARTGNDFSLYKATTIHRRITRRMGLHQIDGLENYVRYLRENPREVELLFQELLIGVTNFFRDPPVWEHLKNEVLPQLLAARPAGAVLRAWVPGCSTGEEAYSLAMLFREAVDDLEPAKHLTLQVFATDLDRDAIERARSGFYPSNIAADVSPERLRRFFVQQDHGFRVSKEIREMLIFAPQNLSMDPPFTKLDLLSCRNLLIYLSAELQKKLIPLFHYSLNRDGLLLLGNAETVGGFIDLFTPVGAKARLYRRNEPGITKGPIDFPTSFTQTSAARQAVSQTETHAPSRAGPNFQATADRLLMQRYAPTAVLANEKGEILYVSGRTGKYLEPVAGKANWNVLAMGRDGLRFDLSTGFAQALREDTPVKINGVKLVDPHGIDQTVDLTLQRLSEPEVLRGTVMIIFTDVLNARPAAHAKGAAPARAHQGRIDQLQTEVDRVQEELQVAREEMQTSQEELKSTNEELQSTNEELQSTNEELTTSKEEMQSLNEELQTVNHELQGKVDELSRSNNDMKNLLNSTDIATLFLDAELKVRRFTNQTSKIINLIPGDAGRPITDISSELLYPALADDAHEVLRTLVFKEQVVPATGKRWFTVKILPYRTLDNVIDGVVITFTDATTSKKLEEALREQASQLKQMAESLPNLVWGCRADGSCDYLSRQWMEYTGLPEAEQLGYGWLDQLHPDDRDRVKDAWRAAVKTGQAFDVELRIRSKSGKYRWFKGRSVPIRDGHAALLKWYGTHTDIDDVKRTPGKEAR